MKFSDVLREKLRGRNLAEVARQLDIPKTLLHEWTKAKRTPSFRNIEYLKRLADYLSMSLDELLVAEAREKIISAVTFDDQGRKYRIKIERIA